MSANLPIRLLNKVTPIIRNKSLPVALKAPLHKAVRTIEKTFSGDDVTLAPAWSLFLPHDDTDSTLAAAVMDFFIAQKLPLATDPKTIGATQDYTGVLADGYAKLHDEGSLFSLVIFDATTLKTPADLRKITNFLAKIEPKLINPAVIVLARPPCCTPDVEFATTQRALVQLTHINNTSGNFSNDFPVNVVYIKNGLENRLPATLNFIQQYTKTGGAQVLTIDHSTATQAIANPATSPAPSGKILLVGNQKDGVIAPQLLTALYDELYNELTGGHHHTNHNNDSKGDDKDNGDNPANHSAPTAMPNSLKVEFLAVNIANSHIDKRATKHNNPRAISHLSLNPKAAGFADSVARYAPFSAIVYINSTDSIDDLNAAAAINRTLLTRKLVAENARIVVVVHGKTLVSSGFLAFNHATALALGKSKIAINAVQLHADWQLKAAESLSPVLPMAQKLANELDVGKLLDTLPEILPQSNTQRCAVKAMAWLLSPQSAGVNGQVLQACAQSINNCD